MVSLLSSECMPSDTVKCRETNFFVNVMSKGIGVIYQEMGEKCGWDGTVINLQCICSSRRRNLKVNAKNSKMMVFERSISEVIIYACLYRVKVEL